jgi:hypothetical protein
MRLSSAPFPHLFGHWPEIAPRIPAAVRRRLPVLMGDNPPNRARYRHRKPADIALAINRLQEELA